MPAVCDELAERRPAGPRRSPAGRCRGRRRTAAPRRPSRGSSRHSRSFSPSGVHSLALAASVAAPVRSATRVGELAQEPRRLARPRQPELAARTRQSDVEQPPLLGELLGAACLLDGQLLLGEPRQEHASNSSPFARCRVSRWTPRASSPPGIEALPQVGDEPETSPSKASASETRRARSVWRTSSRSPSLSGTTGEPARLERGRPHRLAGRNVAVRSIRRRQASRSVAHQQRRALERQPGLVQDLLEVGQAGVRAAEDRHLLERHAVAPRARGCASTSAAPSASGLANGTTAGSRPVGQRWPQHLLGTTERRHEPVRQLEHLRRRAVVLLEPHDEGVREPLRHRRADATGSRR